MTRLTVYHLPGRWGLPSVSPFCLKLDAFLRMVEIPHEAITAATPFGGPKGKAPWITLDGETHGDSSLTIERLKTVYSVDPDRHLSRNARGTAVTIERLIEENLYWAMVFDRWCRPENWAILKNSILGDIPQPMRSLLAPFARRSVKKQRDLACGYGARSVLIAMTSAFEFITRTILFFWRPAQSDGRDGLFIVGQHLPC